MRRLFMMLMAATAIIATSCKQLGYKKTKTGVEYKIIAGKDDKDSLLKAGQFIKWNLSIQVQRKGKPDTTLVSTYEGMPTYAQVDTSERSKYSQMELLPLVRVGDSVEFQLSVDTLKNHGLLDYQGPFEKGGKIVGKFTIIKKFANEQEINADIATEMSKQKGKEVAAIQDYLSKKGIKAQMTKDSVFYVLTAAGDQAVKADSGKQVSIKYKGSLMADGKVFDTNMDSSKHHTDPIKLVIGSHQVIPGWESALPYFGKGGKGTIFVPATMAYGPRGGGEIPANSNLIFDIEVLDVTNAPAPKAPQMPLGAAPHGQPQAAPAPKGK